jgi:sugar phosphate isomerase/epimerase
MAPIGSGDYLDAEAEARAQLESLVPLCEQYGVRIAVQQHHGRFVSTSAGLRALLAGLPPEHITAAWDAGHNGLSGEDADLSLAQLRGRLAMVNLKNGYYRRSTDEVGTRSWKPVWVAGDEGLSDWAAVATALTQLAFSGTICLTAQYTAQPDTDELIRCDLAYAKAIFEG